MTRITAPLLEHMGASKENAEKYWADMDAQMMAHDIDTPLRAAHFLAQVMHESGCLSIVRENMNYSARRLLQVFPKYFNADTVRHYDHEPARIGNRVYANRMGNGNGASGDGYRYRGRGLIQLTGKDNYRAFGLWVGDDVLSEPDKVATVYAVHSAVWFWETRKLNLIADHDDVRAVTRKINGGYNGINERIELLARAKRLLDR